jgi:hypothetical protein
MFEVARMESVAPPKMNSSHIGCEYPPITNRSYRSRSICIRNESCFLEVLIWITSVLLTISC